MPWMGSDSNYEAGLKRLEAMLLSTQISLDIYTINFNLSLKMQ
jgi:hypothetical protein